MLLAALLQLGTIVFPNSGKPEAQDAFLRGVLLLHNFAYLQAKDAFVEAEKIDPKFVLAYWGEAMTHNHPIWNQVDVEKGRSVLDKVKTLQMTARERGYIEALQALYGEGERKQRDYAYEKAMQRVAKAYPDDIEAQVFWALSILGSREWHQLDERRSIAAAAILEPLFPTHPDHPGVLHYLIHAYDDPIHAPLGLRAARQYAKVASSAPHALHMPSHIFLQLGMWEDAAHSNEAAYALSKQWGEPDLHSLSWLEYVYLQQHRYADAKHLLDEAPGSDHHGSGVRETMQIRYAVETGDYAFDFTSPVGKALRAIAGKRFDDAQKSIDEAAKNSDEPDADELRALLASARGQMDDALKYAHSAIKLEENLGVPSGPPNFKPAHELYGELLLKAGRKKEAAEQFQMSLLRTPNRAASLAGAQRVSQ
ncbi:MAG: hypothetical protein DMF59_12890 [Acidobacteria bacterium]|nr:MAG: hypothetical protein DMF59_12890 [Acidobacteriota bacterium]